ncbi:MFS transporter [Lentzea atacamensis]|uniref:MFS transporter n=1 Tax=Lentzea atacamensis TaxID=531938 RepID=A0A316I1Q5_9PSEU|nr:MFS transporter [Lentzea atacamensis]PWK86557.1 MFS transporter [Lentzea atacamensis]
MGAFGLFCSARVISLLGSAMAVVALPFAVLDHGTVLDSGLVLAARLVPHLGLVLIGGSTADRFSRSAVLTVSHVGSGAAQAVAATALLTGNYHLGLLVALQATQGAFGAFTSPAARGVLPELVEPGRLQKANSLLSAARYGTGLIGPAAAGLAAATIGAGWALAFDAGTFLTAAVLYAKLRLPGKPAKSSLTQDLKEGWDTFRTTTWVWTMVLSFCLTNAIYTGVWTVLGLAIAKRTIGEFEWGVVLSASGAGLALITLILYRTRTVPLWITTLVTLVAAAPLLALGLQANTPTLVVIAFVEGMGMGTWVIAWETSLQRNVPNHMLSRVTAYDEFGSYLAIPLGAVTAPLVAAKIGDTTTATIAAFAYVVAALIPLPSLLAQRHAAREPERQSA